MTTWFASIRGHHLFEDCPSRIRHTDILIAAGKYELTGETDPPGEACGQCARRAAPINHGTTRGYRLGCRLDCCASVQSAYNAEQHEARSRYKATRSVSTAIPRAHIRRLAATGMSVQQVAKAAGVAASTAHRIDKAQIKTTRAHIVARILAVTPDQSQQVPALGATRRARALKRMGWSGAQIAQAAGLPSHAIKDACYSNNRTTRRSIADGIARAYDQLAMTPGPHRRSITIAERNGWAPPLAWDDIDTDPEPTGLVLATAREAKRGIEDPVIVERIIAGDYDGPLGHALTPDMRAAVIRHFSRVGHSDRQIGDRLGVTAHTIALHRKQYGIPTGWAA